MRSIVMVVAVLLCSSVFLFAQGKVTVDQSPFQSPVTSQSGSDAIWDLQFSNNLETLTGALGNAGSEFDGTHGYSTRWASNLLHKFVVQTSTLVEQFSIPGVTGLRDLAYDGAFMYGGAAANTIYQMDFETKTLIGTIPSPVAVRHIAYDEGADAFWVGTWDTPPTKISRTGVVLGTLTTGLIGQYGSAYDAPPGAGPFLYVFDQGSGAGLPQIIREYNITTGTATGVSHDVASNFPAAAGIAGGLWVGEGLVPGFASIGGVLQGTPDYYFAYELAPVGPVWMELVGASSGSVAPGDVGGFIIRLIGVELGLFQGSVVINSNDQTDPIITIPVTLDVIVGLGEVGEIPTTFDISRNYPNPFNPSTTLDFQLPQVSQVKLEIYNVLGQKVRTLVDAQMQPGRYKTTWDGRNDLGAPVTSGVYIYRFVAGDFKSVQKMILMK